MKKVLFGILAIFMSLSLAYGSGSLIQNFVLHSQSQTGNEEEEEIKITASGNWKDNAAGSFNGGNGSPDNPYKIATAGQLALLSNEVNGGNSYSDQYFQLTADINLSAHYWTSIGHQNYIYRAFAKDELLVRPFKGTFDGNGKRISGITISVTRKTLTNEDEYYNCVNNGSGELYCPRYFGLFGYVSGATIKNFSVDGKFNFEGGTNSTYEVWATTYVGGAVGYAENTTISNVDNVGLKILNVREDGQDCIFSEKQYIGGVVGGVSGGRIEYCDNSSSIKYTVASKANRNDKAEFNLGGIVGKVINKAVVLNCYSSASISFEGSSGKLNTTRMGTLKIGGVIADSSFSTIKNCFAYGNQLRISNKFYLNEDEKKGYDLGAIGGIVGHGSDNTIDSCFNYKEISASEVRRFAVGGIVGRAGYSGSVNGCGNFGNLNLTAVQGAGSLGYGGIVGYAYTGSYKISNCANYGNITTGGGYNISYIGGIAGDTSGTVEKCVNYGTMSGYMHVGGIVGRANKLTLENSINFSEKVAATGGNGGFVVGSVVDDSSISGYYNTASGNGGGVGSNTGRSTGDLHTSIADQIFGDTIKDTYVYSTDAWMRSVLPVNYFGSSNISGKGMLEYALVPTGALANVEVTAKWESKEDGYKDFGTDLTALCQMEHLTYDKEAPDKTKASWKKETKEFQYLIGVNNYSAGSRKMFRFNLSLNFKDPNAEIQHQFMGELSEPNNVALEYYGLDKHYYSTIYNAKFKVSYKNDIPQIPTSNLILKVSPTSKVISRKNIQIEIYAKTEGGEDNKTGVIIKEEENHIIATSNVGTFSIESGEYQYKDAVKYTATPKIGWRFLVVQNSNVLSGNEEIKKYGVAEGIFEYVYQPTIYVFFEAIEYDVTIKKQWDGKSTEYKSAFALGNENKSSFEYSKDSEDSKDHLSFGYQYNFYVCGASDAENINSTDDLSIKEQFFQIKDRKVNGEDAYKYENFESNKVTFSRDDIIGDGKAMTKIDTNSFYIVVTRTKIEYEVVLNKKINSFDKNCQFYNDPNEKNGKGGFTSFSDGTIKKNFDVEKKFAIKETSYTFYETKVTDFYGEVKLEKLNLNSSTKVSSESEIDFTVIIEKWIDACYDLNGQGHFGEYEINLYTYYQLKTYNFQGSLKIDDKIYGQTTYPSKMNNPLKLTTEDQQFANMKDVEITKDQNNEISTISGQYQSFYNKAFHYTAPVTLEAKDIQGYQFVGWFKTSDSGICYSVNNTFTYFHEYEKGESQGSIDICAFYITSEKTNKLLEDDKKIYTISSKEDLIWLSNKVEGGETFAGCIFNQTADIDMKDQYFNPIGNDRNPFKGVYNGNNYSILGLTASNIHGAKDYLSFVGLFGVTDGATLKNLTFRGGSISGYSHVGALVGYAKNTIIENVQNHSLTIIPSAVTFYDIYNESISLGEDGTDYCGNYYATRQYFGGVVGLAENTKMIGLSNKAAVGEESVESVGGVVGCLKGESILQQSFNEGDVYGKTTDLLANGLNASNVKDCFARNSGGATTLYNATGKNGSVNGVYSSSTELDNSIWISVNGKLCLKYFYWN